MPKPLQKIKKTIAKYFPSLAWPWEIISGLFIVLLLINNFDSISGSDSLKGVVSFVLVIIIINLVWGVVDGLMHIFTSLLEKGRYNKMISHLQSSDKKTATQMISDELDQTIINIFGKKTKISIAEIILKDTPSISQNIIKKQKISKDDIIGAFLCVFFVFLPCILILPFFLRIE